MTIDLRGGNQNPWASFLPQMFQQMMMMGLKSKYDMEALKAKSIYDAGVKKEERSYMEGRYDIEKQAELDKAKQLKQTPGAPTNINLNMAKSGGQQLDPMRTPTGLIDRGTGRPINSGIDIVKADGKLWGFQKIPGHRRVVEKGEIKLVKLSADPKDAKPDWVTLQDPSNPKNTRTLNVNDKSIESLIKNGWTEVKTPGVSVTTNIGDKTVTTATKTKLEGTVLEADSTGDALESIGNVFKDDYLTYLGKGTQKLYTILDKAGVSSGDAQKEISDYTTWKSQVDIQTLMYRKLITGVAGGPEEMKAIEKTTINTKYDSPTQFRAKRRIMVKNTLRVKQRAQYALEYFGKDIGDLTNTQKAEIARKFPLIMSVGGKEPKVKLTAEEEANAYLKGLD